MTTAINLSDLSAPQLLENIMAEEIFQEMLADFKAKDPSYSAIVESDPVYKILQVAAYREYILRVRVNDAVRGVLLAYAIGTDLEHLAAQKNIKRQEGETDAALRLRVQLAPESYSVAGPSGAYAFHSLSAHADIKDVKAISPSPGLVKNVILAKSGNGTASQEILGAVYAALTDENIRPLTDQVTVASAEIVPYQIDAELRFYDGPDSAVVTAEAQAQIEAYAQDQHRIGRDITLSAIYAALHRPGVQNVVITSPADDIIISDEQAAYCTQITLSDGGLYA
ncbi:MAG: baseplate J/gp47 family protein [Pseudomonadota bacterium]